VNFFLLPTPRALNHNLPNLSLSRAGITDVSHPGSLFLNYDALVSYLEFNYVVHCYIFRECISTPMRLLKLQTVP
jgi:hypothetical protein